MKVTTFLVLALLTALPSIAEEEQRKTQKQTELTPVIRAMFSSPRNRNIRDHDSANPTTIDGYPTWGPNCTNTFRWRTCTGYKGL